MWDGAPTGQDGFHCERSLRLRHGHLQGTGREGHQLPVKPGAAGVPGTPVATQTPPQATLVTNMAPSISGPAPTALRQAVRPRLEEEGAAAGHAVLSLYNGACGDSSTERWDTA